VRTSIQPGVSEAASRADPEFGGDKLGENLAIANRVFEAYDPNGTIRAMLAETGYGKNPDIIRFMVAIGRDLSPDRMVSASGASGLDARAQFPNTPGLNP